MAANQPPPPPRNPKLRPGNYRLHARCDNCGKAANVTIPRGLTVQSAECEVCGCKGTLSRDTLCAAYRVGDEA